jgi:hypothetical protein
MRESFTDPEILDLTICLSAVLGLGRRMPVLGITGTPVTDVEAFPSRRLPPETVCRLRG